MSKGIMMIQIFYMQIIILKIKRNGVILMKLEYTKYGDYYLPNIVMPEESKETKGKE